VLAVASCGGGNSPQALAKQSADMMEQLQRMLITDGVPTDDPKVVALQKKMAEHGEKVKKLSEADQKIYDAEWEKLLKERNL
jgi:S-adenosylmethionine synthetase